MKNNKVLALALSAGLVVAGISTSYADEATDRYIDVTKSEVSSLESLRNGSGEGNDNVPEVDDSIPVESDGFELKWNDDLSNQASEIENKDKNIEIAEDLANVSEEARKIAESDHNKNVSNSKQAQDNYLKSVEDFIAANKAIADKDQEIDDLANRRDEARRNGDMIAFNNLRNQHREAVNSRPALVEAKNSSIATRDQSEDAANTAKALEAESGALLEEATREANFAAENLKELRENRNISNQGQDFSSNISLENPDDKTANEEIFDLREGYATEELARDAAINALRKEAESENGAINKSYTIRPGANGNYFFLLSTENPEFTSFEEEDWHNDDNDYIFRPEAPQNLPDDEEAEVPAEQAKTEVAEFQTIRRPNPNMLKGEERVVQEGKNGVWTWKDGVKRLTKAPQDKIIEYGTKQRTVTRPWWNHFSYTGVPTVKSETPAPKTDVTPSIPVPAVSTTDNTVVTPGPVVKPDVEVEKEDDIDLDGLTDSLNEGSDKIDELLEENEKNQKEENDKDKEKETPKDENEKDVDGEKDADKDAGKSVEKVVVKEVVKEKAAPKATVSKAASVSHSNPKTGVAGMSAVAGTLAVSMAGIVATRKRNNK